MSRRGKVWLLWGCVLALVLTLRRLDPWGDRGMLNALSQVLVLAAVLVALVFRLLRRELSWRRRLAPALVVLVLVAGLALFFPLAGFSGEMLPRFRARFARQERLPAAPVAARALPELVPGPGDFAQFLGPTRDQSLAGPRLARTGDARATLVWRRPLGAGWSAFALCNGVGLTLEQDELGQHALALDLADGTTLWRTRLDEPFTHALGGDGPRATPTLAAGRVFVQSSWGVLAALDARDGRELWRHDLVAEFGLERAREAELAQYGRAASPLVVGALVIVPAGGAPEGARAGLVAFDAESGERRWTSPPRHFSYASPSLGTLLGREVVLCVNEDTLSAHALASGALLFEHPWPGRTSGDASASQARVVAPDRVFVSKGYGGGGALLGITERGGALEVQELWHAPRLLRTKFTNVVLHGGHVYALDDGILECVELASGEKRWKEGRYGHGQILAVGETLLVLAEDGELSAVALDPERANEVLWRFQALSGKCWAHLALAGSRLVLRNAEECAAWELPLAP